MLSQDELASDVGKVDLRPVGHSEHAEIFFRQLLGDMDEPIAPFGLFGPWAERPGDQTGAAGSRPSTRRAASGKRPETRGQRRRVSSIWPGRRSWPGLREAPMWSLALLCIRVPGQARPQIGILSHALTLCRYESRSGRRASRRACCTPTPCSKSCSFMDMRPLHWPSMSAQYRRPRRYSRPYWTTQVKGKTIPPGPSQPGRISRVRVRSERTIYPLILSVDDLVEGFRLTAHASASIGPLRICRFMHTTLTVSGRRAGNNSVSIDPNARRATGVGA